MEDAFKESFGTIKTREGLAVGWGVDAQVVQKLRGSGGDAQELRKLLCVSEHRWWISVKNCDFGHGTLLARGVVTPI